jgi:anaerobic selenocysteine-containing dehydrogenase
MERRLTTCRFCDGACRVAGVLQDGELQRLEPADPNAPAFCSKAAAWSEYVHHPDRITTPLHNVGTREAPHFERCTWNEALDDIAKRLKHVIGEYGPEAVAFSAMPNNYGSAAGMVRRLLNYIGSPNYITPMELCVGNTAQLHRLTYGWWTVPKYEVADCIVYTGITRSPDNWPAEYLRLQAARKRGAKLIVIDPRESELARTADYHLKINYGTDAALFMSWINVIISEKLYDDKFVRRSCVGFNELVARSAEYMPQHVAGICGVSADAIRETARVYANSKASIIPWGVVGDMQRNSTSVIRAQCILRAICGFLDKSETLPGMSTNIVPVSVLEAHNVLSQEQRDKQLGTDTYPLFTYKTLACYRDVSNSLFGVPDVNLADGSCMAHPPTLFSAMRGEGPYEVKAFFAFATNTLMNFANQQGILAALKAQDLVVVYENFMTPTAQLADYVLPGDCWMERDTLNSTLDISSAVTADAALLKPPGECRDVYWLVRELAARLGLGDVFPWADRREAFDYRLTPAHLTFDDLLNEPPHALPSALDALSPGEFATPSGKVELYSTILRDLGYDPLPYYKPADKLAGQSGEADGYPLEVFIGLRERASYNTCLRQIRSLRADTPEPLLLINPADAHLYGVSDGMWCKVETAHGAIRLQAHLDGVQPVGTIRVPHGWWKPELGIGEADGYSGAMQMNDGMIVSDDDANLDVEQGLPNLRGGIYARVSALI